MQAPSALGGEFVICAVFRPYWIVAVFAFMSWQHQEAAVHRQYPSAAIMGQGIWSRTRFQRLLKSVETRGFLMLWIEPFSAQSASLVETR
jgi:hypothetical protein